MASQNTSIYIPFVYPKVSERFMFAIFAGLKIGHIESVTFTDVKKNKRGEEHKSAFIHVTWADNEKAGRLVSELEQGLKVMIYYSQDWYWTAYKNTSRSANPTRPYKPRIVYTQQQPQAEQPQAEQVADEQQADDKEEGEFKDEAISEEA